MKRPYLFAFTLLFCSWSCAQQSRCNRALRFNHLRSKLDSVICIPDGYQIMQINNDSDLTDDGRKDKAVRWQKIKLIDGDTIYYSIYVGKASGNWRLYKRLNNLKPLYFKNYDFESKTGNELYDSIKTNYSYPTMSDVEFVTNSINLTFYTSAVTIKRLFFTYSLKDRTWILTREIQWFAPTRYEDDRKQEYDRVPENSMRIDDFDILKYIGW